MNEPSKEKGINGLILSGGESSRMGKDKSTIEYFGRPQRDHLIPLLQRVCDNVFLSCKAQQRHNHPVESIVDSFDIASPLNGILSAFQQIPTTAWLTVPVDMPYININSIEYLIAQRNQEKVATCYFDSTGVSPEPLFTLWEPKAYELLMIFFQKGKISPRDFLNNHDVNIIHPADPKIHTNINTREDLEEFFRSFKKN